MNVDEFVKQPGEVQHLVEVRVRNVPQSRHYSIACIDNPMSLNHFVLKPLPTMVQMSLGINSVTYVLPVLPLSVNVSCVCVIVFHSIGFTQSNTNRTDYTRVNDKMMNEN